MNTRTEILKAALEAISKDRNNTHGKPEDNFQTIADLWNAYLGGDRVLSPKDVAMLMALLKIARIRTGDYHPDHYSDLAGYAACGAEVAKKLYQNMGPQQGETCESDVEVLNVKPRRNPFKDITDKY